MDAFENLIKSLFSFLNSKSIKPSDIKINNETNIECKLVNIYSQYYKKQNPRISIYLPSLAHSDYLLVGILLKRKLIIKCWKISDVLPLILKSKICKKFKRFAFSLKKLLQIPTTNPNFLCL